MNESSIEIKLKNNHKREYNVLCTISTHESKYILYNIKDDNSNEVYASKIVNDKLEEIDNNDELEMIAKVLDNFNKGVSNE